MNVAREVPQDGHLRVQAGPWLPTGEPIAGAAKQAALGGFASNAENAIELGAVRSYRALAKGSASQMIESETQLRWQICPAPMTTQDCAMNFIREFGARAFRRPVEDDQADDLLKVFQAGAANGGFVEGIRLVTSAMLQSPYFLYHVEHKPPVEHSLMVALPDHELAARLSYYLWDAPPDDELRAAAERGELQDVGKLRAQAARMAQHPRFADQMRTFAESWLDIRSVTDARDGKGRLR